MAYSDYVSREAFLDDDVSEGDYQEPVTDLRHGVYMSQDEMDAFARIPRPPFVPDERNVTIYNSVFPKTDNTSGEPDPAKKGTFYTKKAGSILNGVADEICVLSMEQVRQKLERGARLQRTSLKYGGDVVTRTPKFSLPKPAFVPA